MLIEGYVPNRGATVKERAMQLMKSEVLRNTAQVPGHPKEGE